MSELDDPTVVAVLKFPISAGKLMALVDALQDIYGPDLMIRMGPVMAICLPEGRTDW